MADEARARREDATRRLLNELCNDPSSRTELMTNPVPLLTRFGLEGRDAARILGRLMLGELRVQGWVITPDVRILPPWPPEGKEGKLVRGIVPDEIQAGVTVRVKVTGNNFEVGDRLGFKHQRGEGDFEAWDVDVTPPSNLQAVIRLAKSGKYDVAVSSDCKSGILPGGFRVT